ncbi:alpha/beta fold hydrolase [Knoellia sp. CPCC 206453]|uniref:alpha/beta fold hydrolase n=1 Tax=Knoellia pratensis TaxID=3404796 RepID=UPI0036121A1D
MSSPPPPLVLLPGMNCSPLLWGAVQSQLAKQGYAVTQVPLDGPDLVSCVELLLDRLPPRFAIAGLSLGGIVAMALHRMAPERVLGLGLVATSPLPPTPAQHESWSRTLRELAEGMTAREVQVTLLPSLLHPDALPALREATLDMADQVGDGALADQLRLQSTRVDERVTLPSVSVPTAVVVGDSDLLCPVERQKLIHELVGEPSELTVLPATGHLSPLERPDEVAGALGRWMQRVTAAVHP